MPNPAFLALGVANPGLMPLAFAMDDDDATSSCDDVVRTDDRGAAAQMLSFLVIALLVAFWLVSGGGIALLAVSSLPGTSLWTWTPLVVAASAAWLASVVYGLRRFCL